MKIAAFDLDGTLTRRDSMIAFIHYVVGNRRFYFGFLMQLPRVIGVKVFGVQRGKAKGHFLKYFFKHRTREELEALGRSFASSQTDLFRPDTLARLRWHQAKGHRCVLVSASIDMWVKPIADALGLECVCSKARYEDNFCVGLDGENCHGQEKVNRLQEYLGEDVKSIAYAYGDTSGDREMINRAEQGFWVNKPLPHWD